jgi:hypothetical protein
MLYYADMKIDFGPNVFRYRNETTEEELFIQSLIIIVHNV